MIQHDEPVETTSEESGVKSRYEMVRQIVGLFWTKAVQKEASVSDFIRLVGLEREFEVERPVKEVRVTWVRPSEMESSK